MPASDARRVAEDVTLLPAFRRLIDRISSPELSTLIPFEYLRFDLAVEPQRRHALSRDTNYGDGAAI